MTSPSPTAATAAAPANPRSRVILASLIGTTIEFYDFYVYATAAVLVFPLLFFPNFLNIFCHLFAIGLFKIIHYIGASWISLEGIK